MAGPNDLEIYKQWCEDFRSLNEIMWRVPVILMTLTGGLLFAIAKFDMSSLARSGLLLFVAAMNIVFIIVLFRLRSVMESILVKIKYFEGTTHKKWFYTVRCFAAGMIFVSVLCVFAAIKQESVFKNRAVSQGVSAVNSVELNLGAEINELGISTSNYQLNIKHK